MKNKIKLKTVFIQIKSYLLSYPKKIKIKCLYTYHNLNSINKRKNSSIKQFHMCI